MKLPQFQMADKDLSMLQTRWASLIEPEINDLQTAKKFGCAIGSVTFGSAAGSDYWDTASTSVADFSLTGTPTISDLFLEGFSSIDWMREKYPGITFKAPKTGIIKVTSTTDINMSSNINCQVILTDVNNAVLDGMDISGIAGGNHITVAVFGFLRVIEGGVYSVKLRGKVSAGTMTIGGTAGDYMLNFIMEYAA